MLRFEKCTQVKIITFIINKTIYVTLWNTLG